MPGPLRHRWVNDPARFLWHCSPTADRLIPEDGEVHVTCDGCGTHVNKETYRQAHGSGADVLYDRLDALADTGASSCCGEPKSRGPNCKGEMVCPVHCSKCGHDRDYEDYLDFCSECRDQDPCSSTRLPA